MRSVIPTIGGISNIEKDSSLRFALFRMTNVKLLDVYNFIEDKILAP